MISVPCFLGDPLDWEVRGSSSLGPFQCKCCSLSHEHDNDADGSFELISYSLKTPWGN